MWDHVISEVKDNNHNYGGDEVDFERLMDAMGNVLYSVIANVNWKLLRFLN